MEYLIENILVKNIDLEENTPFINLDLFQVLNPNEFFIYHYLVNAPKDYVPTHQKLRELMGLKSGTSIANVVQRLKHLNLITIERVGGVHIWSVFDTKVRATQVVVDYKRKEILQEFDKFEIIKEISALEEALGEPNLDPYTSEILLEEIAQKKYELKNGRK